MSEDKTHGRPMPAAPEAALAEAIRHHQAGHLDTAERLYRDVLASNPGDGLAHYSFGVLLLQGGAAAEAAQVFKRSIAIDPDYFEAHVNLGVALQDLGRWQEAIVSYGRAITLNPEYPEVHHSLGVALNHQGKWPEAAVSFRQALNLRPDFTDALNGLAIALQHQGEAEPAIAALRHAIELDPGFAEAHNNLGNIYRDHDRLEDAVAAFRAALSIRPDYIEALNNLGKALKGQEKYSEAAAAFEKVLGIDPCFSEAMGGLGLVLNAMGRFDEALVQFGEKLALERGPEPIDPNHRSFRFITKPKIDHDIEQLRYLAGIVPDGARFARLAESYEAVRDEIEWQANDGDSLRLSDVHRSTLAATYNRAHNVVEMPRVAGPAVNPNLDAERITRDYFANGPGMAFFDGMLTADALSALRRLLLESTIWFDIDHRGGYLGTYLNDGLACPLILQIAEELRLILPAIFEDHRLNQLWAYKYDSRLNGIGLHADFAAINVNFWITPDAANRNPDRGGLVVFDRKAPLDWHFKSYNADISRMREYLAENDSGKMVVPYAANRVVMFNSDLFHETDEIDFKPGYENRRINVTMLFGHRNK